MRLGTFRLSNASFIGVLDGNDVIDLAAAAAALPRYREAQTAFSDMRTTLASVETIRGLLKEGPVLGPFKRPLDQLKIQAPIANPNKIICIGLNYLDHAIESHAEVPTEPVIFTKFRTSITGPGQPIRLPRISKTVDYEAELAVVIGKTGKRIPEEEAMEHVAAYTVFNDVSARDLQNRGSQWTKGKALDTFAPLGPYLVTRDEIADPHNLAIKLELNGKLMQNSSTSQLIFKIPQLISFLSELVTLEPGDLIATGTPPGVGMARKPPVFLQPGDTVKVSIAGLGELVNPVVADS
ncbi:2-keto-4-pentenoate hydratase/2-oxohepta-3-ene-1,7-dioic acid hydratase in catechol pathway [Hydrogenispora ethanolica]|uniref:2-keto-4-pentenoate hydratase/2-oxohepta-3-ene-1,7-dioic acid hydratase in catechol pathway n=1 Tax=Hydrogenispora ethanolica TaxID=1082276 RepID=A0A4R1R8N8_HYDET|nr:fumarylacetoacetate hydrolase family protein [Hydrogenispora ethanolica]TCL61919.1 2-keto-4-pentenoate hydratase/2-oxohepta-3-ene-1,7-dioic acid hydratase in catechol pathway [Hydrogenispora ethanolica]